jgi:SAM-dependent methyltransferase
MAGMDAEAWNERYRASELVWSAGPNQFVEAELAGLPPGRAVDLACGEGRNAIWLARRGWRVTAVDFARAGLDKGRTLAEGLDIDWVCADATTWRRADEEPAYDVALLAYLQVAAAGRGAAVRSAYDSIRAGGTFLLVAHDSTNLEEGTGGPQDPAVLMTAEDVLTDLAGETFEVQRADRVARVIGDGHGEEPAATAWDCLVRVVRRA